MKEKDGRKHSISLCAGADRRRHIVCMKDYDGQKHSSMREKAGGWKHRSVCEG